MTMGFANARRTMLAAALVIVASASTGAVQAAPRAAELGPEVAISEPSGGYVGRLEVSPQHGPVGTPLTVTGEGFAAGQEVEVVWRTVKGRWKVTLAEYFGREFTPVAYRIATVKSDDAGRIKASFVAPEDFGFQHDIVVQQAGRLLTQTAFNLDMTVRLTARAAARSARRSASRSPASAGASSREAGCFSTTTSSPASCRW